MPECGVLTSCKLIATQQIKKNINSSDMSLSQIQIIYKNFTNKE